MTIEDYKNIVLNSLLNKEPKKEAFLKKMGPNLVNPLSVYTAPVNPLYFDSIDPKHSIVLTQNVYEVLEIIEDYNYRNKKEVPFVLYGKETKGGAIIFDDIDCDFKKLKDDSASFENVEEYLLLKIRRFSIEKEKNKVICAGHTHPFNGNKVVFNYSLMDLIFHLQYSTYEIFYDTKYNNKFFSLMKTITKDFNFIYYDASKDRFFKVSKVFLQKKKNEFIPLSSYNFCDD